MKTGELSKRVLSLILMLAAFVMSEVCASKNMMMNFSVMLGVEVIMGLFFLLGACMLAFLPYIAKFYYNKILGLYFHNPNSIRPREWYIRYRTMAPTIIFLLVLIAANFIFSFM